MTDASSKSRLQQERYRRIIEKIDQLPALPTIVTRLLRVVNSPQSSAEDAAALIEKDPALTSKMLRLANSAFYGMPRAVSSINSAVVILGFNAIKSLVLGATLFEMFSQGKNSTFNPNTFWFHSIMTAMAGRTIARYCMHVRLMDPESAFCAGILHDIGKLIFNVFMPEEYAQVHHTMQKLACSLIQAEDQVLGINHAELGKIVADRWALPIDLEYAMVYHHKPDQSPQVQELVYVIHMADAMATAQESLSDINDTPALGEECLAYLRISKEDYHKIESLLECEIEHSRDFLTLIQ